MSKARIYFDHNATTPIAGVLPAFVSQNLVSFGNPSSIHWEGRGPKALIREARQSLAELIYADPLEIVFTSGGSEANNLALKGILNKICLGNGARNQLIVSSVEHPSVFRTAQELKKFGVQVDIVPVDRNGILNMDVYESLLSEKTALVSMMFANNETGCVFPISRLSKLAHKVGALFHCDAVQALGKSRFDVRGLGVDLASFSAHKFYSLKGCGALYVKKGLQLESLIHGGGQERGRRAGTENVLAIAALGEVIKTYRTLLPEKIESVRRLRDEFEVELLNRISGVRITAEKSDRLCNTSSVVIEDVDGESLLMNLDIEGFSVSTGAACSSGSPDPSPVLLAMGLSLREAQSSLRVSLGFGTSSNEIGAFLDTLERVVNRIRQFRKVENCKFEGGRYEHEAR